MTKEVYIALIQKDVRELDMIAQGLYETELPSPTVIKLAATKAQEIISNLQLLSEVKLSELQKPLTVEIIGKAIVSNEPEVVKEKPKAEPAPVIEPEPVVELHQEEAPAVFDEEAEPIFEPITLIDEPEIEELVVESIHQEEPVSQSAAEEELSLDIVEEEVHPEPIEEKTIEPEIVFENTEPHVEPQKGEVKSSVIEKVVPSVETKVDAFSKNHGNSLGNSLANKKIDSIKQAISMGDRFRYQRELFQNSAEMLVKTINYLDTCANLEQAQAYLATNFNWDAENTNVVDFLNVVSRRF